MASGESRVANWRHAASHGRLLSLVDDQWINGARNVNRPDFDFSYLNSRSGFVDLRKNYEVLAGCFHGDVSGAPC